MSKLLIIILTCISLNASCQSDSVYEHVDQMPQYPGGEKNLLAYIGSAIQYPDMEAENDIQGMVVVSFVVNEDGTVSDIKIRKGITSGMDKEVIKRVKSLTGFLPGRLAGKTVKVRFILPIKFRLHAAP